MEIEYKRINSKEELVLLIQELSNEKTKEWENISTSEYLEALSSWLEDADGFYQNFDLEISSEKPSWQLFADALQAATIYE